MAASRNYFGSASDGTLPLAQTNGSWTASSTVAARRGLTARSLYAGTASSESWTAGQTKAHRYFVLDRQLRAGTISGITVKCYIAGFEANANMNVRPRLEVYVVSQDLTTVRGTLLAIANYGSGNEVAVTTTTGIAFANGDTVSTVSGIQDGDRVAVVIGASDASGTTPALSLYFGGTESDVAEDESTTGNHASWIEFSDDRIFYPLPQLVGAFANPDDNGSNASDPTTCDFAAQFTCQAGDLVCMVAQYRGAGSALAIADDGGQTWTAEAAVNDAAAICRLRLFWAIFDGTWDSTPSVDFPSGLCNTVVGIVFRPTNGANTWAVDQAQVELDFTAGSSPFTKTITGQTTTKRNTVTLAVFGTPDDNTWGTTVGPGWTVPRSSPGGAQFRNTAGSDQSMAVLYKISPLAGATGDVSMNQATNGGDAGTTLIITFYEKPSPLWIEGTVAPTGTLAKQTSKSYAGATTPTGALAKVFGSAFAGAIAPAASLIRSTGKALAGLITPTGAIIRDVAKTFAGDITPTGSTSKLIARTFAGAIAPAGAVLKLVAIALVGSVLVAGAVVKQTGKALAGLVEPIGALVKLIARVFGGGITPTGEIARSVSSPLILVEATVEQRGLVRMTEIREDNAGTLAIEERERLMLAVEEED